jgi:hypothetical protein
MEYLVMLDAHTPAGAYFISTPMFLDNMVSAGITSPIVRCTQIDWDKPPGFARLVQVPDAQKNRHQPTEWTLPSKCIALVTPVAETADPQPEPGTGSGPLKH